MEELTNDQKITIMRIAHDSNCAMQGQKNIREIYRELVASICGNEASPAQDKD